MMPTKRDAAYFKEHRKDFELALELGCSPKEAKAVRAQIKSRESFRALCRKHGRPTPPRLHTPTSPPDFLRWNAQHMMRD